MAGARLLIAPVEITADAFAPFGALIDAARVKPQAINDGTTMRHSDLAALDLREGPRDPVIGIYLASARRFPLRIAKLERHRKAAQVFLPLGNHRFVVVVAPGNEAPDWAALRAFVTRPGQGVSLARGCWHHGLIALGDGDRFAVLEGGDYRSDTHEAAAEGVIELAAPDS
ncbi:MAG TPA: ureidoglycolate lyase [Usitatibacter sp.]|nr:ureidoglycolate lyase [Usitatibacter sp.]